MGILAEEIVNIWIKLKYIVYLLWTTVFFHHDN